MTTSNKNPAYFRHLREIFEQETAYQNKKYDFCREQATKIYNNDDRVAFVMNFNASREQAELAVLKTPNADALEALVWLDRHKAAMLAQEQPK